MTYLCSKFLYSPFSFPCDMVGDVSFEELRAAAYDDAKRGLSLQSVVRKSDAAYTAVLLLFRVTYCVYATWILLLLIIYI